MIYRLVLGVTLVLAATPVFAGPCTERLAELEKAITAKHEGAGPALGAPATTGSTQAAPATSKPDNDAMQMIAQAKQLDQQGKESECMSMATKIGATAPMQTDGSCQALWRSRSNSCHAFERLSPPPVQPVREGL